jgi:hypothetical protein
LQQNLPRTSVRDLEVHGADLVIATHGRGFWIMDDIAPLRALADDAGGGTRLLPPAPALRVRPTGFVGSPMPKDEPRGANPPPGACIDYVLDPAAGAVALTIYDAHGVTVRAFSSDDQPPRPDPAKLVTAPEWIGAPRTLGSGAGAHRFVWDLHYAPRAGLVTEDQEEPEEGVWAPPGDYRLELRAGGQVYRQTLSVAADPRVSLPAAAYARQLALAREIETARVEIATALAGAERIDKAMRAAHQVTGADTGAALITALIAARAELRSISDAAPEKRSPDSIGSPPTSIGGLRYLESAFRQLARAVDGADTVPSRDAERGYVRHRALLDAALAKWAKFKGGALVRLNAQLTAGGAAVIAP